LSGGQIALVIRNAAARAAMARDCIGQANLIAACEQELAGNFDGNSGRRIGFGTIETAGQGDKQEHGIL